MSIKKLLIAGLILTAYLPSFAKEGMWLPTMLNKYNITDMKEMGFKLSAEDIYSTNHASMKDAVVLFGPGCTGELISGNGLLITNHHCGYDEIQKHSSLEHDYLTNGFWAKNRNEELPNPGLTASILQRMEDVTTQVLAGTENQPADSVQAIIARNSKKITTEASSAGKYKAVIQTLFYGNQYLLSVYEVFTDVRLVGAPPSAVGKFGGDTDNWTWPRHTGDFSYFRVYANKDNQPANYSADNVPYKPKKFFNISIKGVMNNDFTLVFGYPGRTQEFAPSWAVQQVMEQSDPNKIKIRTLKLNILAADMNKDPGTRIKYAAKYANTSNAWKKWQGEVKGLRRLDAVAAKRDFENQFTQWTKTDKTREQHYGKILPELERIYNEIAPYSMAYDFYSEIIQRGTDLFNIVSFFENLESQWASLPAEKQLKAKNTIKETLDEYFNEYEQSTDEKVFAALVQHYAAEMPDMFLPSGFKALIAKLGAEGLTTKIYRKSVFTERAKIEKAIGLQANHLDKLKNDPAFKMFKELKNRFEQNVRPQFMSLQSQIEANMKKYTAGIIEMRHDQAMWPDANQTLRVSYGKVEGFEPMDGVKYDYFTTIDGIMQKDNPNIYDYNVPQTLRDLYRDKDYGRYGKNGQMNVCFTASNHTTGGNSGSPVIDANGNLIGVNFDRCWEGTMSDLMFDPARCRNIILDIRYALFITDKLGGAGYLIDEMNIVE